MGWQDGPAGGRSHVSRDAVRPRAGRAGVDGRCDARHVSVRGTGESPENRHLSVRALPKLAALAWVAATCAQAAESGPIQPGVDYHSFANVSEFRVKHVG